jgi:type I restriction enzyme R subunit
VLAPGGSASERSSYDQVVLTGRMRDAALRINPDLPTGVVEQAVIRLLRAESQNALAENERVHQLLTGGVPVEHRTAAGEVRTELVWLVDWDDPATNDWLVVQQYTVVEAGKNRRADVVVFLNGLPVALLELKNPGDAQATLRGAWNRGRASRTPPTQRWRPGISATAHTARHARPEPVVGDGWVKRSQAPITCSGDVIRNR